LSIDTNNNEKVHHTRRRWDWIFLISVLAATFANVFVWLYAGIVRGLASLPLLFAMWWYFRRSTSNQGKYYNPEVLEAEHCIAVKSSWFLALFYATCLMAAALEGLSGWLAIATLLGMSTYWIRELLLFERERNAIRNRNSGNDKATT